MTAKQLPLPMIPRPVAELVCEKWRAILGTKPPVNALRHWHETNPAPKPAAAVPTPRKRDGRVRSGLKAKPINFEGRVYTIWKEACAATGKTADAIRWAIKTGAK